MHRLLAKHQIPKTRVTARWPQGSAFKYSQALLATVAFLTNPQGPFWVPASSSTWTEKRDEEVGGVGNQSW